jgi:TRAP-type C4-dicarboxylate transport system permease large subunit
MVIVIIAGALMFGRFLAVTRIPYDIADWVVTLPVPKTVIMLIIFVIYIIGGMFMDALVLLLITKSIFPGVYRLHIITDAFPGNSDFSSRADKVTNS